tara:strand:+ start:258 stop:476 length:219 start_codon:yes stop_codon:yes gene_type:complete
MPFEGLGSMSAMLIMISIIVIGALMAIRNKKAKFKEGRNKPSTEPTERVEPKKESSDVGSQLDQLKKDVNDQ